MSSKELIDNLIAGGYLKTSAIIDIFKKIDRKDFVPDSLKNLAYINDPLPIGYGQTISQPLTVAFMLELLSPKVGEKILDIGSGSGWVTALLAEIVGERGIVIAIERISELKEMSEKNVKKYNFIKKGIVNILEGDGSKGAPKDLVPKNGFDKIIAAAAIYPRDLTSSPHGSAIRDLIPDDWKNQLKISGRIVAPVRNSIVIVDKISESKFEEKEHFGFSFVPLVAD